MVVAERIEALDGVGEVGEEEVSVLFLLWLGKLVLDDTPLLGSELVSPAAPLVTDVTGVTVTFGGGRETSDKGWLELVEI